MKKSITFTAALLVALGGALFVMISRPAPEPGSFMPQVDEGALQIHFRRADQVIGWVLELDEALGSEDRSPSAISDLTPFIGRGTLQMDLSRELSDMGFSCALEVIEAPKAMELSRAIRDELVARGGEALPLKAPMPRDITPLFILKSGDNASYWGIWRRGAGSVLLMASSLEDLASMSPDRDLPERFTSGGDWARLNLPLGSSSEGEELLFEWSLSWTDERVILSSWDNREEVLLSQESLDYLESLDEVPLYGGGSMTLMGIMTGIWEFPVLEALDSHMDGLTGLFTEEGAELADEFGFDLNELVQSLKGRVSFVLGSKASGLLGEIPGGYLLFEGVSSDFGDRLTRRLTPLNLPFGTGPLKKAGWDGGISFKIPFTGVLAYGPKGLLVGVMDPDEIDRRPMVPERIADSVERARHLAFSVDVRALLNVLTTYRSLASFFDDDLSSVLGSAMELLSPWDRWELYTPSLGRSELILYRLKN